MSDYEMTPEEEEAEWDAYVESMANVCECEQDWRCGLHRGQPTWLETRYDDQDCPEWAR